MVRTMCLLGVLVSVLFLVSPSGAAIMNNDLWQEASVWYADGYQSSYPPSMAFDGTADGLAPTWWGGNWTMNFTDNSAKSKNGISQVILNIGSASGAQVTHVKIIGADNGSFTNSVILVDENISGFGEHVFSFPTVTGKNVFQAVFTQDQGGWYFIQELDAVPEPATLGLLAIGGVAGIIRKRK